jgi:hypothetical protein
VRPAAPQASRREGVAPVLDVPSREQNSPGAAHRRALSNSALTSGVASSSRDGRHVVHVKTPCDLRGPLLVSEPPDVGVPAEGRPALDGVALEDPGAPAKGRGGREQRQHSGPVTVARDAPS